MRCDPETVRRLLERDLIEWADEPSLRLIWADLLQLQGDPLGLLVILDHVGEGHDEAAARARAEADALRQRLHARLWSTDISTQAGVTLHWQRGFVRELELHVGKLPLQSPSRSSGRGRRRNAGDDRLERFASWMAEAMQQYALRWVEVVRVHISDDAAPAWARWVHGNVYSSTLREIHVGWPPQVRFRPGGAWEAGGAGRDVREVDRTIGNFPRLRWLSIAGELARLPACAGPSQTRVHFLGRVSARALTSPNRAALARGLFDASVLVHGQAFTVAQQLGAQAEFLLDDLALFLRPPLSKKDPRPSQALRTLATIGEASEALLPELLSNAGVLSETHARREALVDWLGALGRPAKPALPLIEAVLSDASGKLPKSLRDAAERARERIDVA